MRLQRRKQLGRLNASSLPFTSVSRTTAALFGSCLADVAVNAAGRQLDIEHQSPEHFAHKMIPTARNYKF